MSAVAAIFMAVSWTLVLGLAFWSFRKVLRASDARRSTPPDDG